MKLYKYFLQLLGFLFPFYCLGCGKIDHSICQYCLDKVKKNEDFEAGLINLDLVMAVTRYEKGGMIAQALHNWKYDYLEEYAHPLKFLMKNFWTENLAVKSDWQEKISQGKLVATFIPMHPDKFKQREFNQAEELAKVIFTEGQICNLLIKNRISVAQMTLKAKQRKENVEGIFSLVDGFSKPEEVLLIDDVATTLATLEEAAKILKQAGVKKVYALVLARQTLD